MTRIARVICCVEYVNGTVRYRTFTREGSIAGLKARLRSRFKDEQEIAHVGFGNGTYTFHYGAH